MHNILSVGEVAARSGLSVSALHFYERKGLIRSLRSAGNQRRYERDVLRRLAVIRAAQALGVALSEIAEALGALPAGRALSRKDWGRMSSAWADRLDRRIAALQQLRNTLGDCIGCGCLSIDRCNIFNPDDRMGRDGPGSRLLSRP